VIKFFSQLAVLLAASGSLLVGCQLKPEPQISTAVSDENSSLFVEAGDDIALEEVNRRKWDNPVVADLDGDGYLDLLLTDHGYAIKLYWNNEGTFSKGYDLIVGDTHGIGVGDYNNDGDLDVVVSRGGGSGSNARNAKVFHFDKNREITESADFSEPLKKMRGRTAKLVDGDNDGDLDLVLMGFPSRDMGPEGDNNIYENNGNGDLSFLSHLPRTYGDGQKLLVTDFNKDHIPDYLVYGHGRLRAYQGQGNLVYKEVTGEIFEHDIKDVTGVAEFDFDNDGDFDLFISRATNLVAGETFYDEETSTFAFFTRRGDFKFEDLVIGDVLNIRNLQTAYPDQDVFIGEAAYPYQFSGEIHSGQAIKLVSSLALGWPDVLDKKGVYIGYVGNGAWRIAGRTGPPTAGVVQGVKSYPAVEHTIGPTDLLLENRDNKFVDVTKDANLLLAEHTTGVAVGDYDNNGYQDIFVVRRGNPSKSNKQHLFLNRGNGVFERAEDHGLISSELGATGAGAESFDYNRDGRLDLVFANERGRWHLFKNRLTLDDKSHFITVKIGSSPTGKATAQGALVSVKACNQRQLQRVGSSGAPYTQSLNNLMHFGMGSCDQLIDVSVRWSNGEVTTKTVSTVNSSVEIGVSG